MNYLRIKKFGKRVTCPSTETLLRCAAGELAVKQHKTIEAHLDCCDFCGAEMEFLSKNPPMCDVPCPPVEMPPHLQTLATELFATHKKK